MNKKIITILSLTLLTFLVSIGVNAQVAFDSKIPQQAMFIKSALCGDSNYGEGFWSQATKSGDKIKLGKKVPDASQVFRIKFFADGWYFIESGYNVYVDVTGGKNENGIRIQTYTSNNSTSQMFRFVHQGNGRFKIFTVWGSILSPVGQSTSNGTEINTWADHNGAAAEWYLYSAGSDGKKYMGNGLFAGATAAAPAPATQALPEFKVVLQNLTNDAGNEPLINGYFPNVTNLKFADDNKIEDLQTYIRISEPRQIYAALLKLIPAVKKNKDTITRQNLLKAISEGKIKKAAGFADTVLLGSVKQMIQKEAGSEPDAVSKQYITVIANNLK